MRLRVRDITLLDRVHEHVVLPPMVVRAIDTPQFQRLRSLKQLGASSFLYPGAVHTRFEHSIGVAHMARAFLSILRSKQPELGLTDRNVENAMLAGLFHDVGHGPFSHLFEDVITRKSATPVAFCHEEMSQVLARRALEPLLATEDLAEVLALMSGKGAGRFPHGALISNKSTGIDVDRLDYFLRDSLCCFGKPTVDVRALRLFHTARVMWTDDASTNALPAERASSSPSGQWVIAFEEKMAIAIRELFALRAKLHKQVYQHHVTKAIGHMIGDVFALAEPHFSVGGSSLSACCRDPDAFLGLGDWILEAMEFDANPRMHDAQQLIRRLRQRELYKLVFCQALHPDARLSREDVEQGIAKELWRCRSSLCAADFIVDMVVINHGLGRRDPLTKVSFFNPKRDPPVLSCVAPGSSPLFSPQVFEEKTVMVFQRSTRDVAAELHAAVQVWADRQTDFAPQIPFSNLS